MSNKTFYDMKIKNKEWENKYAWAWTILLACLILALIH